MFNFAAGNPITSYNLQRSLRFRASAGAYLSRTFGSGGNRNTWTWSGWRKRGQLGTGISLFSSYPNGTAYAFIQFTSGDNLRFAQTTTGGNLITSQVFRDPSAYYHLVVAYDDTQATASNRVKIYVNGSQVTAFSTSTYPDINFGGYINGAFAHFIGQTGDGTGFFDGYATEDIFVGGQQLTPSSFGSTNSTTGVWQPAAYTGTYGTNGFYLPFTDNSALTTSSNVGLGKDFSGNGNYWTTNNISITAGVTYDSMTDVPTLTSATAGNYAVMNPLQPHDSGIPVAVTDGNLKVAITYNSGSNMSTVPATMKTSASGKWYWEAIPVINPPSGGASGVGVTTADSYIEGGVPPTNNYLYIGSTGVKFNNNVSAAYGASYSIGDVIGVALDVGAGTIEFYKNGVSQGVAYTGLAATGYYPIVTSNGSATRGYTVNFGQQPFTYTPPSGFVALNTYNLPDSTIKKGSNEMNIALDTGANIKATTEALFSGSQFLEWIKDRANANNHQLLNGVTGLSAVLQSNTTAAETTYTAPTGNSVGWAWKAGTTSSSNTNGTITSTVSVNATAGFSVVTYTGTGANATVGHGLGVAPSFIMFKSRNNTSNWIAYHASLGATRYIHPNLTVAAGTLSTVFNNTAPTSSVFSLGSETTANGNGSTTLALCWAEIAGFSKIGSYTGNGSADGTFVYTGFRPKFVVLKNADAAESWNINDTARSPYNLSNELLFTNANAAEAAAFGIDFLSNGFKVRNSGAQSNGNGNTIIYYSAAENPFKNSLAR